MAEQGQSIDCLYSPPREDGPLGLLLLLGKGNVSHLPMGRDSRVFTTENMNKKRKKWLCCSWDRRVCMAWDSSPSCLPSLLPRPSTGSVSSPSSSAYIPFRLSMWMPGWSATGGRSRIVSTTRWPMPITPTLRDVSCPLRGKVNNCQHWGQWPEGGRDPWDGYSSPPPNDTSGSRLSPFFIDVEQRWVDVFIMKKKLQKLTCHKTVNITVPSKMVSTKFPKSFNLTGDDTYFSLDKPPATVHSGTDCSPYFERKRRH